MTIRNASVALALVSAVACTRGNDDACHAVSERVGGAGGVGTSARGGAGNLESGGNGVAGAAGSEGSWAGAIGSGGGGGSAGTAASAAGTTGDGGSIAGSHTTGSAGQGTAGTLTGGATGSAGSGSSPECADNAECINAHFPEPYVCMEGRCVALKSSECPVVLGVGADGLANLRVPAPVVVGAYSNFEPGTTVAKSAYNFELAVEEFNDAGGGLPGGPNGSRRPIIAVVCMSRNEYLQPSLDHLIDDLEVPGIIASLRDDDLQTAFEYAHTEKGADVLFLSPFAATDTLRTLDDDGLLWHVLGSRSDLAAPYVPLVARAEAFQDERRGDPMASTKVLLVESDYSFNPDLAERVTQSVAFNGSRAVDPENVDYFQHVQIESNLVSTDPDVTAAVDALDPNDPPQIVIALTTGELFERVIPDFELAFDDSLGHPRPLYLLSPLLANESAVLDAARNAALPTLRDRLVGVDFAAYDRSLYARYLERLTSTFSDAVLVLESSENYYDAAYLLMYAFAAVGEQPRYDGFDLVEGLRRLIREDVPTDPCVSSAGCFEIDDATIVETLSHLGSSDMDPTGIALVGTLGPPSFDRATGARRYATSVWCVDDDGSGNVEFVPDVLDYAPETETLQGSFPCFPGF